VEKSVTKEQLIDGYAEWLSRYKWIWFATLTFGGCPGFSRADRLFRRWITEIEAKDGTDEFRWVRVTERGAFGDNIHFHSVIGGLYNGNKFPWILRWQELAGSADIFYYRPHAGGLRYMLKGARPGSDFEIEMEL
jgi:hypothetical protein